MTNSEKKVLKLNPKDLAANLPKSFPIHFNFALKNNFLSIELVTFDEEQAFSVYEKDHFYFIIKGTGQLMYGQKIINFSQGNFLFVPSDLSCKFFDLKAGTQIWRLTSSHDSVANSNRFLKVS